MKRVVEYKLHGGLTPYFIADGGYFPIGGKLIGVTKDDGICYVPPSPELVTFNLEAELSTRNVVLVIRDPLTKEELTEEQKATITLDWWNTHV